MPPDVVVVVPTYNEVDTIADVVARIRTRGPRVLVVDDASPDGTGQLADALAADDEAVSVLHRTGARGLGRAYAEGFAVALATNPEIVCEMDADLSHDPAALPALIAAVHAGADLALGSRYVPGGATEGWSPARRILSRGGNLYARTLLGLRVRDVTSGFRAYRSDVLRALEPATCRSAGYAFQVEMTDRAIRGGFAVTEVPIVFRERVAGDSKMSWAIAVETIRLVTAWGMRRAWHRMSRRRGDTRSTGGPESPTLPST